MVIDGVLYLLQLEVSNLQRTIGRQPCNFLLGFFYVMLVACRCMLYCHIVITMWNINVQGFPQFSKDKTVEVNNRSSVWELDSPTIDSSRSTPLILAGLGRLSARLR